MAEIAYIDTLVDDTANLSQEARELKAKMQEIERSVFILRGRKQDFLDANYWEQMEGLLVDLARATGRFNDVAGLPEEEEISADETLSEQTNETPPLQ